MQINHIIFRILCDLISIWFQAQLIRIPIAEIPKGSSITAVSLKSTANDFTKIVAKYINIKNPFKNRDQLKRANERMNKKEKVNTSTEDVSNNSANNQNNKKDEKKQKQKRNKDLNGNVQDSNKQNYKTNLTESKKEKTAEIENFNDDLILNLTVPKSSIQFISDWRLLKGKNKQQSAYLKVTIDTFKHSKRFNPNCRFVRRQFNRRIYHQSSKNL